MNQDDHERFLEIYHQYQKARRQVESIIREHISSGPHPTSPSPITAANFTDWERRLRDAQSEEQRCKEELCKSFPVLETL